MSSIHDGTHTTVRERRQPAVTAIGASQTRKAFGDEPRKELPILTFINMYNHYMKRVDQADQDRGYYSSERKHYQTWKLLWHFLLDTTVGNCYKVSPPNKLTSSHYKFVQRLARDLLLRAQRPQGKPLPPPHQKLLSECVRKVVASEHVNIRLPGPAKYCTACTSTGTILTAKAQERKVFGNLSHNSRRKVPGTSIEKRRERSSRSLWGCEVCNLSFCRKGGCWQAHLDAATSN